MPVDRTEKLLTHYLGGSWRAPLSVRHHPILDPADGTLWGRIVLADPADVDRAVAAATEARPGWAATPPAGRLGLIQALLAGLERRLPDLAAALALETGAAPGLAARQAGTALAETRALAAALEAGTGPRLLEDGAVLAGRPHGVCAVLTAALDPAGAVARLVLPALAAGCCVIWKPGPEAPVSALVWTDLLDAAGAPPGVFSMLQGCGPVTGAALAGHDRVAALACTAGAEAAAAIRAASARRGVPLLLDPAGAAAALVFADGAAALPGLVRRGLESGGRDPEAPQEILVEAAALDGLAALPAAAPCAAPPPARAGELRAALAAALGQGARLLSGGEAMPALLLCPPGLRLPPLPPGPLVALRPFATEAEAVAALSGDPRPALHLATAGAARIRRLLPLLPGATLLLHAPEPVREAAFAGTPPAAAHQSPAAARIAAFRAPVLVRAAGTL